jgi:SCY1-like protein 2
MFANALKSFSSNITSNYTIAPQPSSTAGPWKIFDAKSKRTGKAASVFVFEKRNLELQGGGASFGARSNGVSLRRVHEEVLERLKKEASSLARLRHPSILELAEPMEETSRGGLMFVTEAVVSSLSGLLQEKDEQERSGGRSSRYVVEDSDGTRGRRELELDELELQRGMMSIAKGLEFLHESAGLVHANLTPDAVMVNAKGDWKLSGLSFCGPHEGSTTATSLSAISLYEVLNHDPRLPRSVQLNLDYTSPDFVLDNSLTTSSDMFSLGLLIIALYNRPHTSPLSTGGSLSSYKRVFTSSSTVPSQSNNFLVPSSHPLPPKLASELLPRLITRRPAQRLTAKEFQEASYFDNILVSTIRFLDTLPAKTSNEKSAFMRGLPRIMPQFPKSVLEKKVLPALVEEMKDKDLLAPILANIFAIVKLVPNGKRAFTDKVVPRLREIFITTKTADKDTSKEAALMVLLENMEEVTNNCSGKEFRDDILPIVFLALESPTHALVDAALSTLRFILPSLDFSTIKNEFFPVIAQVFSKTSSLNIKIRGLEAFCTLCGGNFDDSGGEDDLDGIGLPDRKPNSSSSSSIILDKYTVQEKIVPLIRAIKTKEPGVMMAALKVLRQVGQVADTDFLAIEVLPILWAMSLGPLLNLQQFQACMVLIKSISGKIEREQTKKLQDLSSSNGFANAGSRAGRSTPGSMTGVGNGMGNGDDVSFESLVSGRNKAKDNGDLMNDWGNTPAASASASGISQPSPQAIAKPTFSWQSSVGGATAASQPSLHTLRQSVAPVHRTVTPDLAAFGALTPSSRFSKPLQPSQSSNVSASNMPLRAAHSMTTIAPSQPNSSAGGTLDWSAAVNSSTTWSGQRSSQQTGQSGLGSFALPPPPTGPRNLAQGYNVSSTPTVSKQAAPPQQPQAQNMASKSGLDKYESLL